MPWGDWPRVLPGCRASVLINRPVVNRLSRVANNQLLQFRCFNALRETCARKARFSLQVVCQAVSQWIRSCRGMWRRGSDQEMPKLWASQAILWKRFSFRELTWFLNSNSQEACCCVFISRSTNPVSSNVSVDSASFRITTAY